MTLIEAVLCADILISLITFKLLLIAGPAIAGVDEVLTEIVGVQPLAVTSAERDTAARRQLEARGELALPLFAEALLDEKEREYVAIDLAIDKLVDAEVASTNYESSPPRPDLTRTQKREVASLVNLIAKDASADSRARFKQMLTEVAARTKSIDADQPNLPSWVDQTELQAEVLGRLTRRALLAKQHNDQLALHSSVLAAFKILLRSNLMMAKAQPQEIEVEVERSNAYSRFIMLSTLTLVFAGVPLESPAIMIGGMAWGMGIGIMRAHIEEAIPLRIFNGKAERHRVDELLTEFWKRAEKYVRFQAEWNGIIYADDLSRSSRLGSSDLRRNYVKLLTSLAPGVNAFVCDVLLEFIPKALPAKSDR